MEINQSNQVTEAVFIVSVFLNSLILACWVHTDLLGFGDHAAPEGYRTLAR
jgi:hypothetical protein